MPLKLLGIWYGTSRGCIEGRHLSQLDCRESLRCDQCLRRVDDAVAGRNIVESKPFEPEAVSRETHVCGCGTRGLPVDHRVADEQRRCGSGACPRHQVAK